MNAATTSSSSVPNQYLMLVSFKDLPDDAPKPVVDPSPGTIVVACGGCPPRRPLLTAGAAVAGIAAPDPGPSTALCLAFADTAGLEEFQKREWAFLETCVSVSFEA